MTEENTTELANALVQARASGNGVIADAFAAPGSVAAAYAVQSAQIAALAPGLGPVAAWKTGRKGPGEPISFAPILASLVRRSPARFTPAEAHLRGVELEFAFLLDDDPPPADTMGFADALRPRVSLVAVIEVVGSRLVQADAADPLLKLADLQLNAGLVIGQPLRTWTGLRTDQGDVRWEIDGQIMAQGPAETPGGAAFATFCAFAQSVGTHCGGLKKGQVVATGSLTGLRWAPPGARVRGEIAGLGRVETTFAP